MAREMLQAERSKILLSELNISFNLGWLQNSNLSSDAKGESLIEIIQQVMQIDPNRQSEAATFF